MNIPLNIDWRQILLHLLNFVILAGGLYVLLYKPVKNFMAKREAYYKKMDDDANKKLAEAQEIKEQYDKQLEEIQIEISQKRLKASKDTEAAVNARLTSAQEESERILCSAKEAASKEREKLLADAREEIMQLAVSATKKLVMDSPDSMYDQFTSALAKEIEPDK